MSLTPKRKTTEKAAARSRRNGRQSRGAVTPAGKARVAAAHLRHGFYAQAQDEAMVALGENPKDYAGLLQSLVDDLEPRTGLQSELVLRMGRTLWRMERAERMQDGLALKRVQSGLETEALAFGPRLLHNHNIYQHLVDIGQMMHRRDSRPSSAEIEALVNAFGATPPDDVQRLFPLLRAYGKAAAKAPGPVHPSGGGPIPSAAEEAEKESTRQALGDALREVMLPYAKTDEQLLGELDKARSPENIAALMAPRDENSLLIQRMEDSNLRQLWRLTRMFLMIKRTASEREEDESPTPGDYIGEKKELWEN